MYDDFGIAPQTHNFVAGPGSQGMTANHNDGITPTFMNIIEPDPTATEREGRPMFKETPVAVLSVAGDPHSKVPIEIREAKERFPVHYEKWMAKQGDRHISGTPLRQWPLLSAHEVAEMEALNIFNVEGLAQIADNNITRMPALRSYREKAKNFLDHAADSAVVARWSAEKERMMEQIAEQGAEIKRLAALIDKPHKKG